VGPGFLAEMQLPFHLRGDEEFFWWPPKKERDIREMLKKKKMTYLPYDSFIGMREGIGRLLEML
jgi:hypothetical protein